MKFSIPLLTSLLTGAVATCQECGVLPDAEARCAKLGSSINIENVTVNFAEYVPAGTNLTLTQDYNQSTCGRPSQVVSNDLCRVAMAVSTSNRSEITLEAWLPTNWTGRFLSTGNGGVSGCIQYEDIAYTAGLGFAAVGANNGHNGSTGEAFYNNLDIVHDFVDRSFHTGVVVGKEITKQYYGAAHKKSYYLGCSTGGRQGFKAVQDYPGDFDGVVAGAPALGFANLSSWSGNFLRILGTPESPTFVPTNLWPVIHAEILNQCDGIDGLKDGIIEDPTLCQFRPEAMQCSPSADTSTCLTSTQVASVRAIFTDFYGNNGSLVFPRMQPGSEIVASFVYYTGTVFPYTSDYYRYIVYNDPTWDAATLNLDDVDNAAAQNPFNIQTWNGDLSAFQEKGGKVLHWHGLMDPIITSDNSPRYYNHVSRTMGLNSSDLDDFYRFFRVSGTGHCAGGDGAHSIGQSGNEVTDLDPQNNILMRIVDWVENGNAPETITGTKFVNDDKSQGVAFSRDHCKYPLRNVLVDGTKATTPEGWGCIL